MNANTKDGPLALSASMSWPKRDGAKWVLHPKARASIELPRSLIEKWAPKEIMSDINDLIKAQCIVINKSQLSTKVNFNGTAFTSLNNIPSTAFTLNNIPLQNCFRAMKDNSTTASDRNDLMKKRKQSHKTETTALKKKLEQE